MRQSSILAFSLTWLVLSLQERPAQAEIIYGISNIPGGNQIFSFESGNPGVLLSLQPIRDLWTVMKGSAVALISSLPMESCMG